MLISITGWVESKGFLHQIRYLLVELVYLFAGSWVITVGVMSGSGQIVSQLNEKLANGRKSTTAHGEWQFKRQ